MADIDREAPVVPGTIMQYDRKKRESKEVPQPLRNRLDSKLAVRSVIMTSEGWTLTFWDVRTLIGGRITYPEFDHEMFSTVQNAPPRLGSYRSTANVHH